MAEITTLTQQEKENIYLLSNFYKTYKYLDLERGEVIFKSLFINFVWFFHYLYLIKNATILKISSSTKYDIAVYKIYQTYFLFHLPLFISGISSIDSIKENEDIIFPQLENINFLYYKDINVYDFIEITPPLNLEKKISNNENIKLENDWLLKLFKEEGL